jgi:GAF domain-containing protein
MESSEQARLAALRKYDVLDTPKDGAFDRITTLAAKMFNMPIAIISLVDEDRIWFKSASGLEINQLDREPGLCASAILSDELYIVEDARRDPRALSNPLVAGQFGLQFYAASPLTTREGYRLGTFCIIDKKQRFLNNQQKEMLKDLAGIVMDELEIRLEARLKIRETEALLRELEQENQKLKAAT